LPDFIHLLPDNIANQIAAGEVIQRPASAVKELLENAVDAGATEIRLVVNDSGKSLVQVIDNGKGMSETDARMCFERHATSKIRNIDDLFRIKTMGFRGEALASIAAVAQVEIKSRRAEEQLGTYIEIENSIVKKQESCSNPVGTNISMKNLFFNVPARRNFLKSNAAEMRHVVDEFIHVSLAFPGIFFSLTSNGQEIFHLEKNTLKQRIVQLLGGHYSAKLVSVLEKTDYLNIYGFVGKPDAAKKTRGDQYFFVNSRYIKSAYLNHAVMSAFQEMISTDSFPLYVLFIDLDPAQLDINVHPTKQEIKFEDEKIVYAFVQAAVKHALAQFSIIPTLEFDLDPSIQQLDAVSKPFSPDKQDAVTAGDLYKSFTQKHQAHFVESKSDLRHWKEFYESSGSPKNPSIELQNSEIETGNRHEAIGIGTTEIGIKSNFQAGAVNLQIAEDGEVIQIQNSYIVVATNRGLILINQQLAHERIIYERLFEAISGKAIATQQSMFPTTLELGPADAVLLEDLASDLQQLGYMIEPFGKNTFVVQGTPADVETGNEKSAIENLLEQYKHFSNDLKFSKREKLLRSLAWQQSIKQGRSLTKNEMRVLISGLFQCKQPNATASGTPTYVEFKKDYLEKIFGQ
jgi:DNA mismatch repair protein MutL